MKSVYSGTTEQWTHWGQYKFTCFVLCREVVLFSEVVYVYRKSKYLGRQAVSLVERSIVSDVCCIEMLLFFHTELSDGCK